MLDKIEGAIKHRQSTETGYNGSTYKDEDKQNKKQNTICNGRHYK